jgi:hypothetical protein
VYSVFVFLFGYLSCGRDREPHHKTLEKSKHLQTNRVRPVGVLGMRRIDSIMTESIIFGRKKIDLSPIFCLDDSLILFNLRST